MVITDTDGNFPRAAAADFKSVLLFLSSYIAGLRPAVRKLQSEEEGKRKKE